MFTINCFAQKKKQPPIDSLLTELLKAKTDTGKAWLMIQVSNQYYNVNLDEAIKYGEHAVALSQKIKWGKGIVNANLNIGDSYQGKGNYPKALGYSLNALKICEDYKDTLRMPITLYSIGRIYIAQHDFPKAVAYGYKAININKNWGNSDLGAQGNIAKKFQHDWNLICKFVKL